VSAISFTAVATPPRGGRDDADEIDSALRASIEALVTHFRGPPNNALSSKRESRWGSRGSLAAVTSGKDAGRVTDYEAGPGKSYSPLQFIAAESRTDMAGAFRFARQWLGMEDGRPAPVARPVPSAPTATDDDDRRKAAKVAGILACCVDPHGTLAETYLRNRAIAVDRLPDAVRWRPNAWTGGGAVVFVATDDAGLVRAVQSVYQTLDGRKADLAVKKRTNGTLSGAAVRFADATGNRAEIVLAEGPETALSVWLATGLETWACLGVSNIAKAPVPAGARIIVARDADKPGSPADKNIQATLAKLVKRGFAVSVACPPTDADFNDVLVRGGAGAVLDLIAGAVPYMVPDQPAVAAPISPPPDPAAPSVEQVRDMLRDNLGSLPREVQAYRIALGQHEVHRALREAAPASYSGRRDLRGLAPPVPVQRGVIAATGLGKSSILRESVIQELRRLFPGDPVIVTAPTLSLCEEAAAAARMAGLIAVVIRGRGAPRRDAPAVLPPGDIGAMCLDPAAPEDAAHAIEGAQKAVCVRKEKNGTEQHCEHFDRCPYQNQRKESRGADVIFMAHSHLFTEFPEFLDSPSVVVTDEDFCDHGIEASRTVHCDVLRRTHHVQGTGGRLDHDATALLAEYNQRLATAIESCVGPLTAAALENENIDASVAGDAVRLWWRTKMFSGIRPGMDRRDRRLRRNRVELSNKLVAKMTRLWGIVGDLLSSGDECTAWVKCGAVDACEGTTPGATMTFRKPVATGWGGVFLTIDATMRPERVRPYLPFLKVAAMPYPATPYATIRQVLGAPFSKQKLSETDLRDATKVRRAKDVTTARNHLREILNYISIRAAQYQRCLVIAQLDIVKRLGEMGLPENVAGVHFNALAGIDKWKDVDYCMILGRTDAGPVAAETMAENLTGQPVTARPRPWYPKHAGGSEYHPDPMAEACRWSMVEGGIVQALGRPRGVNRTANTSVLLEVFNDTSLPIPVNETVAWTAPTRADVMASRGVALENLRDRARCFPDLWASEADAKKDSQRTGTNAFKEYTLKEFVPVLVTYRLAGPGQKNRQARFNLGQVPDPRSWLEARLGTLARFEAPGAQSAASASNTEEAAPMSAILPVPVNAIAQLGAPSGALWLATAIRRTTISPPPVNRVPPTERRHRHARPSTRGGWTALSSVEAANHAACAA